MTEISREEGAARAKQHERVATDLRSRAMVLQFRAEERDRWARRWKRWAQDKTGTVQYPTVVPHDDV